MFYSSEEIFLKKYSPEIRSLSKRFKNRKNLILTRNSIKPVNLFDLSTCVKLDSKGFKLIKEKIKYKNLSYSKIAQGTRLSRQAIGCFINGEKCIKSYNLSKLINFLKIDKKIMEEYVLNVFSNQYQTFQYNFDFPINVTPLHIRIIGHILGDGCLEKNSARWYQKSRIGGKKFTELVHRLCSRKITKNKKDSYTIPAILMDIVCVSINLSREDLKTSKLVETVSHLPREYKIQLLVALIVDEGSIYKSGIKIVNTNKDLLKSLRLLIISLGYSCSDVKKLKNNKGNEIIIKNNKATVNKNLKGIFIYADGFKKFSDDIKKTVEKYGNTADLWQKQEKLEKMSTKVDMEKLEKRKATIKKLIPLIKKTIKKEPIKVSKFAKRQDVNYCRMHKIFSRLAKQGKIRKIGIGLFASNDYREQIPETLRFKIEEYLGQVPISIKKLTQLTKGNPKSISTQLSKFYIRGTVKRIKRGVYQLN